MDGTVLFVGTDVFIASPQLNESFHKKFHGNVRSVVVSELPKDWSAEWLDQLAPHVVVMSYLNEKTVENLERLKFQRPGLAVLMCVSSVNVDVIPSLITKGLDDFVIAPVSADDLIQRAALRFAAFDLKSRESVRQVGPLTINLMQRTVSNGKETSYLTPIETKIVTTLADQLGAVVERNSMKQLCWGDASITDNALNRKIYEVRRTLRRLSSSINIRTIYGLGFELDIAALTSSQDPS